MRFVDRVSAAVLGVLLAVAVPAHAVSRDCMQRYDANGCLYYERCIFINEDGDYAGSITLHYQC